jgi:hypothetical protein
MKAVRLKLEIVYELENPEMDTFVLGIASRATKAVLVFVIPYLVFIK